jgi:integral membrane protein
MQTSAKSLIAILRKTGWLEGLSWLLLLGMAMPLKYIWGQPLPVKIVGWIHGLLFMSYIFQLIRVHLALKWPWQKTFMGLVASFLPFGTWVFDAQLKKQEHALTTGS